jgi:hypothetical protein
VEIMLQFGIQDPGDAVLRLAVGLLTERGFACTAAGAWRRREDLLPRASRMYETARPHSGSPGCAMVAAGTVLAGELARERSQ